MFTHFNKAKSIPVKVYILGIVCIVNLALNGVANAVDISVNGFANIGLTYSSDETLQFRTSLLNRGRGGLSIQPDTVLGLQINASIANDFESVAQFIVQDRYDTHLTNFVEMAFLRYNFDRRWSIRVGRFSTNSYLFTDYRYVGHAHNWLRPPLELYSPVGSLGNMDGVSLNHISELNFGTVKVGASFGQSKLHNDRPNGIFRITYSNLSSLSIELQATHWRLHTGFLTAVLDNTQFRGSDEIRNIDASLPDIFKPFGQEVKNSLIGDGKRVNFATIGGIYYFKNFSLMAEFADYKSKWGFSSSNRAGYVSMSYSLDELTPYVIAGFVKRKNYPESLNRNNAQALLPPLLYQQLLIVSAVPDQTLRNTSLDQNSFSVGLRWDFSADWAAKIQFDHFRPNAAGSGLFILRPDQNAALKPSIYNVAAISFTTTF